MKSIFTLKSKFVKYLNKESKEITSENVAQAITKAIKDSTNFNTTIHRNKYDNSVSTFVFDEKKCYCIEIEPLNYDKKIKESMIDIIEVPYSSFVKNGIFID